MGVRFWHLFPYPKKYDLILKTYIEANFHTFVRRLKSDSKSNLQGMSKLLDLSSVYFGFISSSFDFVPCSCICYVPKLWPNLAPILLLNPTIEFLNYDPKYVANSGSKFIADSGCRVIPVTELNR